MLLITSYFEKSIGNGYLAVFATFGDVLTVGTTVAVAYERIFGFFTTILLVLLSSLSWLIRELREGCLRFACSRCCALMAGIG